MPKLNNSVIVQIMGLLLLCNGGFMLLAVLVSWYYEDGLALQISYAALLIILAGMISMFLTRGHNKELKKREGYIIVTLGWLVMALSGTLPYLMTGTIPTFTNAFFEAMSGYTTTGSTILMDIETNPPSILFWRSLTNWIGGMGIIVLAIAIIPLLGIGGMQLFTAESPGPNADKLKPRIADTAKRLWFIYVLYTLAEIILLKVAGMTLFDAINHSFSTIATGGFSTKNSSIAYWNDQPLIQYIIIIFMFLGGSNFVLSYFAYKGRVQKVLQDDEFKWYVIFIVTFTIITSIIIYYRADVGLSSIDHPMVWGEAESAVRHALFQVVSLVSTTGFISADYTMWTPFLTVLFFGLMFLGGSAGSTAGGIKIMRHIILIRNGLAEFKRSLHPNAVLPVRYKGKAVNKEIVYNVLGFFIVYMLAFIIGAIGFSIMGVEFITAVGGSASSLANIGPALGELGPINNYQILPSGAKYWATFLMLIGRLELFTVLILFTPFFWRNH